ncbi:substrate-binding periplasmic protein [Planctobacterium marinum]|uniref:Solute-binding protein family 3/N-terminal domain-containing protein n=1 Tax=Planctobacterium marinum TaxID=1631968 RepID=A0AA48HLT5_9ALTE|nr:hypothetical protein MACH26_26720 [Planctobacterium marinum]
MNNNPKSKFNSEKLLNYVTHLLICSGIFLLLMLVSHSVIAQSDEDNQITIAVFEDHREQVVSSLPYGLSWKLIEKAAQAEGLDLIKIATNWQSAINRLKDQRLDVVFGAFKTPERAQWADFTLPLASDASVLFNSPESPILHLEDVDFEQEVVGVISNSTQEKLAQKLGFKHIYPASERKNLVKLLESGRINYVMIGESISKLYCDYTTPCLQQVGHPLANQHSRAMSAKANNKASSKLERLNRGLAQIYSSRETLLLFQEYSYSQDYFDAWKGKVENELASR